MATVRYFTCSNAELANVENVLQASIPPAALRGAVLDAATRAVSWAGTAVGALNISPRSADTRNLFREAFSAFPEEVPPWRPAGASWTDFGDLVAIRLTRAVAIVNGGWIRYFCWGSAARCPECTVPPATYFACSSFRGRYHICMGHGFWEAFRTRDTATMASTLLHEALHIYFSRTVADSRRTGNANCYERFVVRVNRLNLDPATVAACPAFP